MGALQILNITEFDKKKTQGPSGGGPCTCFISQRYPQIPDRRGRKAGTGDIGCFAAGSVFQSQRAGPPSFRIFR